MRRALPLLAAGLALVLATGCAQTLGQVRRALREPGEQLVALPDDVSEEYECAARNLPFFSLERHELNPLRLHAGDEFNHRMVYALCPARPTEVVRGSLTTRIRFKGRVIARERLEPFELKPGRWIVDAFVRLPEDAEAGIYALEVVFEGGSVRVDERITFGVEPSAEG
ncbi:MAG: hypothetical protein R3263_06680 [Myxococcota bacterium]|nr:hypothetical protein [Myxococcota bacterium]